MLPLRNSGSREVRDFARILSTVRRFRLGDARQHFTLFLRGCHRSGVRDQPGRSRKSLRTLRRGTSFDRKNPAVKALFCRRDTAKSKGGAKQIPGTQNAELVANPLRPMSRFSDFGP